jgi:hypothetical protein
MTGQTRQGRTFERRAPEWYATHGLDYERRRLAAASAEPAASPPIEDAPAERVGKFLGRLKRRLGLGGERIAPDPLGERRTGPSARQGSGYFRNFENYRKGSDAAETRVFAHFAATHRDPDHAIEGFRLMLREAPRLAFWAANKHPIAFGEPTGHAGMGLQAGDFKAAFRAAERRKGNQEPMLKEDPILAGERRRLREAVARARVQQGGKRIAPTVARSIDGVSVRLTRLAMTKSEGEERAAKIREIARGVLGSKAIKPALGSRPDRPDDPSKDGRAPQVPPIRDQAQRYKMLEDELRRHDGVRAKRRARDRDGGGQAR